MTSPNPIRAAWSMVRSRFVRRPRPDGTRHHDPSGLDEILAVVAANGVDGLGDLEDELTAYLARAATTDPDDFTRADALAYWINLYNAAALDLARRTRDTGHESVLDLRDAFTGVVVAVAGERLSLDGIEHGKIRRFGDPRIHAALVCGSLSCPTLRHEAFRGSELDAQLDDQMRFFLASGAARVDRSAGTIELSRIFRWYGGDFVWPHRMPTLRPARSTSVLQAIAPWLSSDTRAWIDDTDPEIEHQDYDWSLGCAVRPSEPT